MAVRMTDSVRLKNLILLEYSHELTITSGPFFIIAYYFSFWPSKKNRHNFKKMSMALSPYLLFLVFFFLGTASIAQLAAFSSSHAYFPGAQAQESVLKQVKKNATKIFPFRKAYFLQVLDHFSFQPEGYRTFYQKYLINDKYWHKGGPIFVYTGNEGDIDWFAANTGFMLDIAPKFRALLVFIEHRYYGESMPFGNDSFNSAKTLGYLSSQQALADFAVLIRSLKQNLSSEASPVFVFGGSYGGMLAAWFRMKYPHIATGALASSAPILQFDHITPWSSFYDAVSLAFKDVSFNCYEVIKGSWAELEAMSTKKEGLKKVSAIFKTCKVLKSVYSARNWLWTAFTYTAMVNYPTKANFLASLPAYPVQEMCRIIDGFPPGVSKLSKAFAAASLYYNYTQSEKCFNLENGTDTHGVNGWDWQACTEMVMPMTCSSESMFPPSDYDIADFSNRCKTKYGVTPRPHWITTEFGGTNIYEVLKRTASNIIFSNGMQDPWSRGGVLKNVSDSIIALVTKKGKSTITANSSLISYGFPLCDCSNIYIFLKLGAHHLDFRFATKEDPDWLIEQRKQEVEIIQKWIDQHNEDYRNK